MVVLERGAASYERGTPVIPTAAEGREGGCEAPSLALGRVLVASELSPSIAFPSPSSSLAVILSETGSGAEG